MTPLPSVSPGHRMADCLQFASSHHLPGTSLFAAGCSGLRAASQKGRPQISCMMYLAAASVAVRSAARMLLHAGWLSTTPAYARILTNK